jgi:cell division septal protein FtsQ
MAHEDGNFFRSDRDSKESSARKKRRASTSAAKPRVTVSNPRDLELHPLTPVRREEMAKRKRRMGFTAAAMLCGMAGLGMLAKTAIEETVIKNPTFTLKCIKVDTTGTLLSTADLEKAAEVPAGSNLLLLDLSHVKARLLRLPAVEKAEVSRDYEGRLLLVVTQRQPVAWIHCEALHYSPRIPGGGLLVDAKGTAMPMEVIPSEFSSLPVICHENLGRIQAGEIIDDEKFRSALHLIHAMKQRGTALSRILLHKNFALDATLQTGLQVTFAWDDLEAELPRFDRIMLEAKERKWSLATVNVINERNFGVTFQKPASVTKPATAVPVSTRSSSSSTRRTRRGA